MEIDKKKLILKLSKENNISVLSAQKLLSKNEWDYQKCIIESTKSSDSPSKDIKVENNKVIKKRKKRSQNSNKEEIGYINGCPITDDIHFNWDLYLKNCEKYSKHPKQVPEVQQIGEGYWTMPEIVKYKKFIEKKNILIQKSTAISDKLNIFNRKHKTKFTSWKDISINYNLSTDDIIEYKDYLSFYHMSKNPVACKNVFNMSSKDLKIIKEKAQVMFVLGRDFLK